MFHGRFRLNLTSVSMYGWMDLVFVIYLTGYETVSGFALFCVMKVNCIPQGSVLGHVPIVCHICERNM